MPDGAQSGKSQFLIFDWMRDVTHTEGLTVHAVAIATALLVRQRKGTIDAVRVDTLANDANTSLRSAKSAVAALRTAGLVETLANYGTRGRKASGYRLTRNNSYVRQAGAVSAYSAPRVSAHSALNSSAHSARLNKEQHKGELLAELHWPAEAEAPEIQEGEADGKPDAFLMPCMACGATCEAECSAEPEEGVECNMKRA